MASQTYLKYAWTGPGERGVRCRRDGHERVHGGNGVQEDRREQESQTGGHPESEAFIY